jgi:hypothetical protein
MANNRRAPRAALSLIHVLAIAIVAASALGLVAILYGGRMSAEVKTADAEMRLQVEPAPLER